MEGNIDSARTMDCSSPLIFHEFACHSVTQSLSAE